MSWRNVRSTIELKIARPQKRGEWAKTYEGDFGALKESLPYTSLAPDVRPGFIEEELLVEKCERAQLKGFLLLICLYRRLQELGEIGREGKLHVGNHPSVDLSHHIKYQAKARQSHVRQRRERIQWERTAHQAKEPRERFDAGRGRQWKGCYGEFCPPRDLAEAPGQHPERCIRCREAFLLLRGDTLNQLHSAR